jgi:phosphotransferase system enzyme I (PtsI)
MPDDAAPQEICLHGIAAAPGVKRGTLLVVETGEVPVSRRRISPDQFDAEFAKLEEALAATRAQLLDIRREVAASLGAKEAEIFDVQLLTLDDPAVLSAVRAEQASSRSNIAWVYKKVATAYCDALAGIDDAYLQERVADVRDVARRVIANLRGGPQASPFAQLSEPTIVAADDIAPSTAMLIPRQHLAGLVTIHGSKTSHTAILARSMDIPALVGLERVPGAEHNGAPCLLDGTRGRLYVHPSDATLTEYQALEIIHRQMEDRLRLLRETRAVTTDNRSIALSANLELIDDIPDVLESGAEGIGLFRSEFLFTRTDRLPTEDEQYEAYVAAARAVKPHHVILRTFDLGGDKLPPKYFDHREANPYLGVRAIRFCLAHPEVFRTQLRAMLRASAEGNIKIMYPMVSGPDEVARANAILEEERSRLRAEGITVADRFEIGIMIEVPSAALIADILATRVDFFSIGTNDLMQYALAVDRGNPELSHLCEPTHPGLLRLIQQVIHAAQNAGIWVGVCGEMAGDAILVPLLVGMGVDELSTGAAQVPRVKRAIQAVSYHDMHELAAELLGLSSAQEILSRLRRLASERFPDVLEN